MFARVCFSLRLENFFLFFDFSSFPYPGAKIFKKIENWHFWLLWHLSILTFVPLIWQLHFLEWQLSFFFDNSFFQCKVLQLFVHISAQSKSFSWMKIRIFTQEEEHFGIVSLKPSNIIYIPKNSKLILKCKIQVIEQNNCFFLNTWAEK